jgi:hypothetical protein
MPEQMSAPQAASATSTVPAAAVESPALLADSMKGYLVASAVMRLGTKSIHERTALTGKILRFYQGLHPGRPPFSHDIDSKSFMDFWNAYTTEVEGKGGGIRSPQTLKTRLRTMGDFFDHCVEQKALGSNPVGGMGKTLRNLKIAGARAKVRYRAFSQQEVKRMFTMPNYAWNADRADYFWGPIIANLSGMRLGEHLSLHVPIDSLRPAAERASASLATRSYPDADRLAAH